MLKQTLYSNGKLLLTGEYVVLDGASAIAIPTKYGQSLEIVPSEKAGIHWKSLDENDAVWFEGNFTSEKGHLKQLDKDKTSKILHNILLSAQQLNPNFLQEANGWNLTTRLDFPRNWGLGTSSTLINNIAQWFWWKWLRYCCCTKRQPYIISTPRRNTNHKARHIALGFYRSVVLCAPQSEAG